MTDTPRPASTVMLLRDTDQGLSIFLLQRHSGMDFAGGVTVFPGGGVDDRDRNADIDWVGPEPAWWAQRFGVDEGLAVALVCAAARETFEECGVLLAGPTGGQIVTDVAPYHRFRAELVGKTLSFGEFLRQEELVLRADLMRPWANWITPVQGHTRRYDTFFFVAALPPGQRADGETSEADQVTWASPASALDEFSAGRSFLLPPTWTQLDTLARMGGTVADVLAADREIVAICPEVTGTDDDMSLRFADAARYDAARNGRPWWQQ